jgi:hypothetical protein
MKCHKADISYIIVTPLFFQALSISRGAPGKLGGVEAVPHSHMFKRRFYAVFAVSFFFESSQKFTATRRGGTSVLRTL